MRFPTTMTHPAGTSPRRGAVGLSLRLRIVLTLACALCLLVTAGAVFWYQDARYSLPTPKPPTLATVPVGTRIILPASFKLSSPHDSRPLLLHFFNPDCPCSRFNAAHIRALRLRFGNQVRFAAIAQMSSVATVPPAQLAESATTSATRLFGPGIETLVDDHGEIAAACGVYSTPQAAILAPAPSPPATVEAPVPPGDSTTGRTLLFRGNYNTSRYCADPQTEFVRLALTALVNHSPLPPASREAMTAYGCELPANLAASSPPATNPITAKGSL